MIVEITAPSPGESILEVEIGSWLVEDGDHVEKDQEVAEIESDKATLPLVASHTGKIKILVKPGETIAVGTILCSIDTSESASPGVTKPPKVRQTAISEKKDTKTTQKVDIQAEKAVSSGSQKIKVSPVARKLMDDHDLSVDDVLAGLRRISRQDVEAVLSAVPGRTEKIIENKIQLSRVEKRTKMSSLRRKLSERLVAVRNETAMLTTFNEADMSEVISLRKKYQEAFTSKHGVKLGFMSFFVRAVTDALLQFPGVNSRIEGDEIVTPEFCDIGIAVLSTPIINPPQAAILGMHNIVDRPVAVNGKVEIRPVMYIALSYDHRIIDGKDAVQFLVAVKELIENPVRILLKGTNPEKILLDI
jgi:2-oxoglutarate dehydrogenase E2 component (dihydrolipoamide succinyltransferase)